MTKEELRSFLVKHQIGVSKFAHIVGVTDMAVKNWLDGQRNMSKTMGRLVRTFDKYPQLLTEFESI